jgi:hyperosmotically inducible protein
MGLSHGPGELKTTAHSEEEDAMNHKLNRLSVIALVVAAVLMGLVGCRSTVSPGRQVDDAAITAKVKAKLAADGDINPFNIDVDTNEGVVTLQGRVKKEEARTKAEQLARDTSGVKRVINLVKVGDQT